jgi:hypothetical protein
MQVQYQVVLVVVLLVMVLQEVRVQEDLEVVEELHR